MLPHRMLRRRPVFRAKICIRVLKQNWRPDPRIFPPHAWRPPSRPTLNDWYTIVVTQRYNRETIKKNYHIIHISKGKEVERIPLRRTVVCTKNFNLSISQIKTRPKDFYIDAGENT